MVLYLLIYDHLPLPLQPCHWTPLHRSGLQIPQKRPMRFPLQQRHVKGVHNQKRQQFSTNQATMVRM